MMEDDWNELLTLLTPAIKKQDTVMRQAISPRDRLTVTLRYLATGNTFQDLSYSTRIAANTISKVIDETLRAIVEVLDSKVWNFPSSLEEWQVIAHKFDTLWNFPHCIGALDGKHINFRPPRSDGSIYRNYKGKDSIVLLGLVDAEYRFLFVDVGRNGRMHDSAVLRESPLWTKINDGTLNLPAPCEIPGFCYKLPYVIVGNEAFALKPNLLKPYPDRNLTLDKRIFNYRLSRVRRTVENAFGILANRWRVLLSTISLSVQKVERITYACVLLHNYLINKSNNDSSQWYVPHNYRISTRVDSNCNAVQLSEGQNASLYLRNNRSSNEVLEIRDKFCEYFNTTGIVPFQYTAIERGNY
ncbi:protein ALP1-like [Neodiprion virginianus]|uniref:protein ALP1-like n=1 Tax=Neodiprion virginianus TaxID=2961670 RepID=UPI001EE6A0E8|nr:protein ALP1-like [Neodiprion virginianus]